MKCALCQNEFPTLCESHIIPKLVYRRMKSNKRSRFRNLSEISKPLQDGEKHRMLCTSCEGKFSALEVKFAREFLDPYLSTNKFSVEIGERWLQEYFASVAWRSLQDDLFRVNSYSDIPPLRNNMLNHEMDLRQVLYGLPVITSALPCYTYVFKTKEIEKKWAKNEFVTSQIFTYSLFEMSLGRCMVIAQYAGIVFITLFNNNDLCHIKGIVKKIMERFFVHKLKKAIRKELLHQYRDAALKYKENMTEEFRLKLKKYYGTD